MSLPESTGLQIGGHRLTNERTLSKIGAAEFELCRLCAGDNGNPLLRGELWRTAILIADCLGATFCAVLQQRRSGRAVSPQQVADELPPLREARGA